MTVEVNSKSQMIEIDRPTFFKAQHSREFNGMDVSTSMIRSYVFLKQSSERPLYGVRKIIVTVRGPFQREQALVAV